MTALGHIGKIGCYHLYLFQIPQCGQIEEIRLVKNFKGMSKGYAYVQFADQLSVSNALTYDRTPVEGRPMFVSRYEERGAQKSKADFKVSCRFLFLIHIEFILKMCLLVLHFLNCNITSNFLANK